MAEVSLRVAVGGIAHPTVPSVCEHYPHDGMTSVPIRDLKPSRTALLWLKEQHGAKHQAFAEVADDILAGSNGTFAR